MTFGPDDDVAFEKARDRLMKQFGGWVNGRKGEDPDEAVDDAQLLLDWKWGYGDGDLSAWTLPMLDEFLLEWFPRKVMAPPEMAASTPHNVALFISFLAERDVLSRTSSSLASIDQHLAKITGPFLRALGDSSRHGMAKSIFTGLASLGIDFDPDDPDSIQRMMDTFNDLPFDVRGDMLGLDDGADEHYGGIGGIELPPAVALPVVKANELASSTDVIVAFTQINAFCDPPRKLTKAGRLGVADGILLAEIVGSDVGIRAAEHKIRSTDELGGLGVWTQWALEVGAVRIVEGTLSGTAAWRKLRPAEQHRRAVEALLEMGALAAADTGGWRNRDIDVVIDDGSEAFLAALYALKGAAAPYVNLLKMCRAGVAADYEPSPYMTQTIVDRQVASAFRTFWIMIGKAGLVEAWEARETAEIPDFIELLTSTPVSIASLEIVPSPFVGLALTELGRATLPAFLRSVGFVIHDVGNFVDAPLDEILEHLPTWQRPRIEAEFAAWVEVNGVEMATSELHRIVEDSIEPQIRVASIALAGSMGDAGERAVRSFLETRAHGHALGWLVGRDLIDPMSIDPSTTLVSAMELLALHCMESGGDEDQFSDLMIALFATIPPNVFFDAVWRTTEAWPETLLTAIDRAASDKALGKQARKALMQHRSHVANQRSRR